MTLRPCDREPGLLLALRTQTLDADLRAHLQTCAACRQTQHVATLLHTYSTRIDATTPPLPSADIIWRRAQQYRQAAALRRTSLAMFVLRSLATLYVLCLVLWAVRALWIAQPAVARHAALSLTTGTMPLGTGIAFGLLLLGASSLLVLGRRPGTLLH